MQDIRAFFRAFAEKKSLEPSCNTLPISSIIVSPLPTDSLSSLLTKPDNYRASLPGSAKPVHFASSDDHVAVGEHRCKKRRMVAHRTVGYRLHRYRYIRSRAVTVGVYAQHEVPSGIGQRHEIPDRT